MGHVSIKQRLYPTPEQELLLRVHCGHARFVYNLALAQRKMLTRRDRERGVRVTYASQCRELAELRAAVNWLRDGSSTIQQGALRDLNQAMINFFQGRARYPRFKKRHGRKQSFVVRDVKLVRYSRKRAGVFIPKVGYVRFQLSHPWETVTRASSARVTLTNGRWHVSLTLPPRPKRSGGTGAVGLDRGVAVTVATSDGGFLMTPDVSELDARYEGLQRALARTEKGSARRARLLAKMGDVRFLRGDRTHDWLEKATTALAERYATAVIEDLNIAGMTRRVRPKQDDEGRYVPNGQAAKRGLNRSILGSQWGRFATRLNDKMDVVKVPAAYTSQRCSRCGHTCPENRESQAVFRCTCCGHSMNADVNAEINIRDAGIPRTQSEYRPPRVGSALWLNDGSEPLEGEGLPLVAVPR